MTELQMTERRMTERRMTERRPAGALATDAEVAIVGGGPAGAAVAARLAGLGHDVLLLERSRRWHWRAGGVFSSPATLRELADLGLRVPDIAAVARPIPAMRVETASGATFRLTYGADDDRRPMAVGFDRSSLDPCLLGRAEAEGARVERGVDVRRVTIDAGGAARLDVRDATGDHVVRARVVVGADGPRSVVARSLGTARQPRLGGRVGLSWHVAEAGRGPTPDPVSDPAVDARMVVLPDGAYCGLAPVPCGRVNVGIVLWGAGHRARLARSGAATAGAHVLASIPGMADDGASGPVVAPGAPPLDAIAGASPLGARAGRRAGPGWLLVGDAAGFLDPFTGEGLHRAFVSARLAAEAIDRVLRSAHAGGARAGRPPTLDAYERAMRGRFASKDLVSLLVQAFLARPWLLERAARRLSARERVSETMGLVMGDLVPASRALDPRFLAALLV